jgi:hypothetical protein
LIETPRLALALVHCDDAASRRVLEGLGMASLGQVRVGAARQLLYATPPSYTAARH